ncbi:MAG: flavodoxin family protein [Desulfomonilaceae bacterium]
MKILVVNASPRMESGNTQIILTPFLIGAKEGGASVDIANLARKKITPCIGCFSCYAKTPGKCIHDDEMRLLSERVKAADMLVLATPVYIDGMPALAKKFIDRLVTFMDPHFVTDGARVSHSLRWKFPKKMFLISVCGFPGLRNFDPLVLHFERICENFHSEFGGALLRPAIFSVLFTKKYPEKVKAVLDAVRLAGFELLTNGSVSTKTSEDASKDICSSEELIRTANSYWDRELAQTSE